MLPPEWLPADTFVQDLRDTVAGALSHRARQPGTAVIFDADHTEGTYAAAEFFHGLFERVVIVTPRNSLADLVSLVGRQGIERCDADKVRVARPAPQRIEQHGQPRGPGDHHRHRSDHDRVTPPDQIDQAPAQLRHMG